LLQHRIEELFQFAKQKTSLKGPYKKFRYDHRDVQEGDVFVALKGQKVDGHTFLKEIEKIAALAIVKTKDPSLTLPQLEVEDPLRFLQEYAGYILEKKKPFVCAITGANGKTGTKETLYHLVKEEITTVASKKSHNTKVTVPLTILNELQEEKLLILEMSMTHQNDLKRLVEFAPPDCVLTTTMPQKLHHYSHAKNFLNLEDIFRAKGEVFLSKKLKFAVVQDHDFEPPLVPTFFYSITNKKAPFFATLDPMLKVYYNSSLVIEESVSIPKHHLPNLLGAIAMAFELGITFEAIQRQLSTLKVPPMRFEMEVVNDILFINDAYNANPYTFCKAFEQLPPSKRKIGILGHMTELGEGTHIGHLEVLQEAKKHFDLVFCTGDKWDKDLVIEYGFEFFENIELLQGHLINLIEAKDLVFFKGSRSLYLEQLCEYLKQQQKLKL
jgi:UDP-N-acetylmuramoyl-tripeptide--D-alanyl-D-alanine ligase